MTKLILLIAFLIVPVSVWANIDVGLLCSDYRDKPYIENDIVSQSVLLGIQLLDGNEYNYIFGKEGILTANKLNEFCKEQLDDEKNIKPVRYK